MQISLRFFWKDTRFWILNAGFLINETAFLFLMFDTGYIIYLPIFPTSQEGSPGAVIFFEAGLCAREGVVFGDTGFLILI